MTAEQTRRGPGRPKGTPASDAQKATNPKARKAAQEAKAKRKAARALEKPRWKQLEDGDITVRDLTDKELIEGACANNDGSWEGRRHVLSARLMGRMKTEYKRRFAQGLEKLGPLVLDAFEDILNDDEARAQQVAVGKLITEYTIGKVPEVLHVGVETEWDRMGQTAFVNIDRSASALEDDGHEDIVDAEIVEDNG